MVEQQNGSAYTQILYSPMGKTAIMNGQTLAKAFINLPGGATAIYNSSGLQYYRHTDWLGSSRLTSTPSRTLYSSSSYAPFGEQYAPSGAPDPSFTGQNADTASSLYDFTYREHSPSQGRWTSPDPAGLAAVNPTDPQSWNRYADALNSPLNTVDLTGLCNIDVENGSCGGGAIPCTDWFCFENPFGGVVEPLLPSGGGFGLLPGEDCLSCFPLGPSLLQVLQDILAGNFSDFGVAIPDPTILDAANNGQQPDPSKKNSPACQQAKAQLSSIGHQLSALDSSLRHDYFKNQLAAAGVGCVAGMIGGEAIESPLIGTPAAPGNCAVGAAAGVSWNNVQYVLTNASALGTEFSLMGQEAKAVTNVISACY